MSDFVFIVLHPEESVHIYEIFKFPDYFGTEDTNQDVNFIFLWCMVYDLQSLRV